VFTVFPKGWTHRTEVLDEECTDCIKQLQMVE